MLPQYPSGDGMHHAAPARLGAVGIGVGNFVGLGPLVHDHRAAPTSGKPRRWAST